MTDPMGTNYTLKNNSGEFQERRTEHSKTVSVSCFDQNTFEYNLRVGVTCQSVVSRSFLRVKQGACNTFGECTW